MDKPLRILVVDDFEIVRNIILNILRELGHTAVSVAESASDALELLKKNLDYDLVIADWNMPQIDGLELVRAIRNNRQLEALPILIVDSGIEPSRPGQALEAGASDFLPKPFSMEALEEKLNSLTNL